MLIKKIFIQFNPSTIAGIQKWKGALPNLIKIEKIIIIKNLFINIIIMKENNIKIDAIVWIKKYINADSMDNLLLLLIKIAINDIRLISNQIQIFSQLDEEIKSKVLISVKNRNINLKLFFI